VYDEAPYQLAVEVRMCEHRTPCPPSGAPDRAAARVVVAHPQQGWSKLCNGVVLFDDGGLLLPDGQAIPPGPVIGQLVAV
jgi:hypothetical protein